MKVIDTNVISAIMKEKPDLTITNWLLNERLDDLYTTSICIAELQYGIMRLSDGAKKERLIYSLTQIEEKFFEYRILSFDREAAYYFGYMANESKMVGINCGTEDLQIAAISKLHDAQLVTRNTKDFSHLGIPIINPWKQT